MLYRKIEQKLNNWLNTKYGLFVDGARQVGKTYSLKNFGEKNFENFIYLNLLENNNAREIIDETKNADDFIFRLMSVLDKKIIPHKTCIFLDEIQELKKLDIVTISKFLIEKQDVRYMFSGSLLGVGLKNVKSWPVGYVIYENMYPLDFEEFCMNFGVQNEVIENIKNSFINETPIEDFLHDKFFDLFRKYLVIGGMPDVVENYINKKRLQDLDLSYEAIDNINKKDITKYSSDNKKLKVKEIYDLLVSEINSQNKRFVLSDVKSKSINENISDSFLWMENAGLAISVYNVKDLMMPLKLSESRNLLKLFFEDVGLLTYKLADINTRLKMFDNDLKINYGAIYENFVARELRSHKYENLFYYNNKRNGEVDFVIERNGEVLPIEVKSGKNYERHSAFNNILNSKNYDIKKAYILYNGNIIKKDNIVYLPIYMAGLL